MACYVVMEPSGSVEKPNGATLVRDGFSWPAFFFPPLWLLWHRLWIEALLAFFALGLLSALIDVNGFGVAGLLLTLLVALYVGLEGQSLRIAALRRCGSREWGVVEASNLDDGDARYAMALEEATPVPALPKIVPDIAHARPAQTGMALGLAHVPGRS